MSNTTALSATVPGSFTAAGLLGVRYRIVPQWVRIIQECQSVLFLKVKSPKVGSRIKLLPTPRIFDAIHM